MWEDECDAVMTEEHSEVDNLDLGAVSTQTRGNFVGVSIEGAPGFPFLWE